MNNRTRKSRSLGYAHWPERLNQLGVGRLQSRSLGYAHWPERNESQPQWPRQSRSLGYAHWPEPAAEAASLTLQSRSLGYAHWPELNNLEVQANDSLDHWDMRTGRNSAGRLC